MKEMYLGVDVGTSGLKAIAIDRNGQTLAVEGARYDDSLICNGLGSYDQQPDMLLDACIACIQKLVHRAGADYHVNAISFAGQMHGLVALDDNLQPLRPIISCVDFRNMEQNAEIDRMFGGSEGLLPYTNNKMIPSCTGGKLLWMKEKEPDIFARIHTVINPKDYVRTALCGIPATDESDASGFGLFDVKNRCWSQELLDRLGIPPKIMPRVCPSGTVLGTVLPEMARKLGLSEDTKVVAGAGDAIMQSVGNGAVKPGVYSAILGSGGLISAALDTCVLNEGAKLQLYASAVPGQWIAYAGMMSVGTSVNWLREQCYREESKQSAAYAFDVMTQEAAEVPAGSEGLLFFPCLLGQRNPVEDPFAKGTLVGLAPNHTRGHMYRAMLEGLAFGMRDVAALIRKLSVPIERIHISGGGAASALWCQIIADVFQIPVHRVKEYAMCGALGAATLAAIAAGETSLSFENVQKDRVFAPNPDNQAAYEDMFAMYEKLYPAVAPLFADLKRFEEKQLERKA